MTQLSRRNAVDTLQCCHAVGLPVYQFEQHCFLKHPVARDIPLPGLLFAPHTEQLQSGGLSGIQCPGLLHALPQLLQIQRLLCCHQGSTIFQQPAALFLCQQSIQLRVNPCQITHILHCIQLLLAAKRTLQPVRAGSPLGQLYLQKMLNQPCITPRKPQPGVSCCKLGVIQRLRQSPAQTLKNLQVFTTGMNHLDHIRVLQQPGKVVPLTDL